MTVFFTIFEILVGLFEGANAMYFVCAFLDLDFRNRKECTKWIVLTIVYSAITIFLRRMSAYEGFMLWIYPCIVFLYLLIFIAGPAIKKLFVSILAICVLEAVSTLVSNVITVIFGEPLSEIYNESGLVRALATIAIQVLDLCIFRLLLFIFRGRKIQIEKSEWALLIAVFSLSVSALVMIQLSILNSNMSVTSRVLLLGADIAVIIINIVTIKLLIVLNRQNKVRIENARLKTRLLHQAQYVDSVRQQADSIRAIRHDFRHTITLVESLAQNGDTKAILDYLKSDESQSIFKGSLIYTDNAFVDVILNSKLFFAKENGIMPIARISSTLPPIENSDYCILLGNMLDNAIEALQFPQTKELYVEILGIEGEVVICVKNTIEKSVLAENPNLRTTKSDSENHGYGVKSICGIAEKYNGTVDFYEEDSMFAARVVLYV